MQGTYKGDHPALKNLVSQQLLCSRFVGALTGSPSLRGGAFGIQNCRRIYRGCFGPLLSVPIFKFGLAEVWK